MTDKLKCRRCRSVSERKDLKRVQGKTWMDLVCPNCNSKSFSPVDKPAGG
ncbi:hypothetical protein ABQJ53_01525 [Morganella morganii]